MREGGKCGKTDWNRIKQNLVYCTYICLDEVNKVIELQVQGAMWEYDVAITLERG